MSDYFTIVKVGHRYATSQPLLQKDDLYDAYCELIHNMDIGRSYTFRQKKRMLALHSYRVLYLVHSQEEWREVEGVINRLREKGLMVIPFAVRSFNIKSALKLMKLIKTYSISIIQGEPIPYFLRRWVPFYRGVIQQKVPPVFIPLGLHDHLTIKDLINTYNRCWSQSK